MSAAYKGQRGFSLVVALTILAVISLIGVNILLVQDNLMTATVSIIDNTQAEYLAFTGIQRALLKINSKGSLVKNYAHYNEGAMVYYAYPHNNAAPDYKREDAIGLNESIKPGSFIFDDNQIVQRIAVDIRDQVKIEYIGARFNNETGSNNAIGTFFEVYTEEDAAIAINADTATDSIPNIPPHPQKKWGRIDDPERSTIFFQRPANVTYVRYILFVFDGNSAVSGTEVFQLYAYRKDPSYPVTYEYSPEKYGTDNMKGIYTYDIQKNSIVCTGRLMRPSGNTFETVGIHTIEGSVFMFDYTLHMKRYMDMWDHLPITDQQIKDATLEVITLVN